MAFGRIAIGTLVNSTFTWTFATVPTLTSAFRVAFGRAPSQPSTIYAAVGGHLGPAPLAAFLKSTDNGATWTKVTAPTGTPPDLVDSTFYNLAVAVDPKDPKIVLFANIRLWRSADGGTTWSDVSLGLDPAAKVSLRADQHAIAFRHPDNAPALIYVGNDGGVYRTNDGPSELDLLQQGLADHAVQRAGHGRAGGNDRGRPGQRGAVLFRRSCLHAVDAGRRRCGGGSGAPAVGATALVRGAGRGQQSRRLVQ